MGRAKQSAPAIGPALSSVFMVAGVNTGTDGLVMLAIVVLTVGAIAVGRRGREA